MSYTHRDLDAYLSRHDICIAAADYILRAAAGLARDVGAGGYSCVVTEYQSRKMGVTVNTESRTAELLYAIELDFDPHVEAFFEQPPGVDCNRSTKRGPRTRAYVPDMLVLRDDGPIVVQVKTEHELKSRAAAAKDWVRDADGSYRDLAADRALAEFGLRHRVISTAQLSKLRASNIRLLLQSLEYIPEAPQLQACALAYLKAHSVASLKQLAHHLGCEDLSPLLHLIARGAIHTDLARFALTEPDACFVTNDPSLLCEDLFAAWENLRRVSQGSPEVSASREAFPAAKHLARGVEVAGLLEAGATGRSARRWRSRVKEGQARGLSAVAALSPLYHRSGNRQPKRPVIVLAFAEHVIRSRWTSGGMPSPPALWRHYKYEASRWHPGAKPVSNPTFHRMLAEVRDSLAEQRGGKRAANAAAPPSSVDDRALRASRPFELASCDHYLCDIHCVVQSANNMEYALQPWLTVLRDCYTKSLLAFWITLRPPSRRSCALIIRQCQRSHGRLPEGIVVDRGSDFRSVYFSALMAHCGIDLIVRPASHPRFGSEAEGFFGQFQKLWLAGRPGNRIHVKEVRAVSGNRQPQKLACLTLLDLWEDLEEFRGWFEHYVTPSISASPAVLAADGLAKFPCSGRVICYDNDFLIATAVDDGNYKLDRRRGLHIGDHRYWHPCLAHYPRTSVAVRKDPQDPHRVYALVDEKWVTCVASAAPASDLKHPLKQAVDGLLTLDGLDLKRAIREDADYRLAEALERRDAARQMGPLATTAPQRMLQEPPQRAGGAPANDTYSFDEIASIEVDSLEVSGW